MGKSLYTLVLISKPATILQSSRLLMHAAISCPIAPLAPLKIIRFICSFHAFHFKGAVWIQRVSIRLIFLFRLNGIFS